MKNQRYVFDRDIVVKLTAGRVQDFLYSLRLTPSQMLNFFQTEPSVERLMGAKKFFADMGVHDDIFSFLVPLKEKTPPSNPA